jgi:hypothetical protein
VCTVQEVYDECRELGIGFHLVSGEPPGVLTPAFLAQHSIGLVVADFSPLRSASFSLSFLPTVGFSLLFKS